MSKEGKSNQIEWISHRGRIGPNDDENTIAAFEQGINDGAKWIECDIRFNQPTQTNYVFHDPTLQRLVGQDIAFDTHPHPENIQLKRSNTAVITLKTLLKFTIEPVHSLWRISLGVFA